MCVDTFWRDFRREPSEVLPSSDLTLERTEKSYMWADLFSKALKIPEDAIDPFSLGLQTSGDLEAPLGW